MSDERIDKARARIDGRLQASRETLRDHWKSDPGLVEFGKEIAEAFGKTTLGYLVIGDFRHGDPQDFSGVPWTFYQRPKVRRGRA